MSRDPYRAESWHGLRRCRAALMVAALCAARAIGAADSYPTELPPEGVVRAAVLEAPAVLAAQAAARAEASNRRRIAAGPYEWTARITGQQRRLREQPGESFPEWLATLERPLRLWGKGEIDAEIGAQGVVVARIAVAEAMHETLRALLKSWFGWLKESQSFAQWRTQTQLLARQRQATARRLEMGDASKLDLLLAEAAWAQSAAASAQARTRLEAVAADLRLRFPQLGLPESAGLPEPEPLVGFADEWRVAVLERSHELALARAESRRQHLVARRADADRRPDPMVGLNLSSERGGAERVVGLSIAVPFPGEARSASADRERELIEAAANREAAVQRKIEAEIGSLVAAARFTQESWRRSLAAALGLRNAAELMERAYALGEAGLTELLTTWRQANEGMLQEIQSRLDALESRRRLELDAHRFWSFDHDEETHTRPPGASSDERHR